MISVQSSPTIEGSDLRRRVMGCWLGKAVGGTLGQPHEGKDGPLALSFYDPVPTGMIPNDDLDLQVVWACVLDRMPQPRVSRHVLAQAWLDHVAFPWDEYGVALRNLRAGIAPPHSGSHDNWFASGMGAAIRSEIWACLAPGDPALATAYAYEDACVDHGGDGVWAEVFLAALESLAFVEHNTDRLLDAALSHLPSDSGITAAVSDTRCWWQLHRDWRTVRELIVEHHGHENFTDVRMNVAFTILGWLAGEGDFSQVICIANNCGKDTDCTAATTGALMGILDPHGIPERWLAPIGRSLVLNNGIHGIAAPATLDAFTELVMRLGERLGAQMPSEESATAPPQTPVPADIAWCNWATARVVLDGEHTWPTSSHRTSLGGTFARLPVPIGSHDTLLVRYQVDVAQTMRVRLMLNTRGHCSVAVDGRIVFERDGGRMAPSFHRVPARQSADLSLTAGVHHIVAAIGREPVRDCFEWVIGLGDPASNRWLAVTFR